MKHNRKHRQRCGLTLAGKTRCILLEVQPTLIDNSIEGRLIEGLVPCQSRSGSHSSQYSFHRQRNTPISVALPMLGLITLSQAEHYSTSKVPTLPLNPPIYTRWVS